MGEGEEMLLTFLRSARLWKLYYSFIAQVVINYLYFFQRRCVRSKCIFRIYISQFCPSHKNFICKH